MRRFLFAVLLVVACATGAAADPYDDAVSAFQRKDYTQAARLFLPFAEQGDVLAQSSLGTMYKNGQGVPQDYEEALKWYRLAAAQGDALAQTDLGTMYKNGQGVPQDYEEAVEWYRLAAAQGNEDAQIGLGLIYGNAYGGMLDFVRAHMWFNLAATTLSGEARKNAMKMRDTAASQLTAAQIEEAQEMALRCKQSQYKKCD
jgi:uncharacterized protein